MKITLQNMDFPSIKAPDLTPKIFDKYDKVNRLIIVGNGFDLAHGLKSSFKDFIYDYCLKSINFLLFKLEFKDPLISISANAQFTDAEDFISKLTPKAAFDQILTLSNHSHIKFDWNSQFFKSIINEIEIKNWVDIEILYFDHLKEKNIINNSEAIAKLNEEFEYIKSRFIEYLNEEMGKSSFSPNSELLSQFLQPIQHIETRPNTIEKKKQPDRICILNFNYTDIAKKYGQEITTSLHIPIHGQLKGDDIAVQGPVFGFGDEIDKEYEKFELLKNDEIFKHIKSFKYLQFSCYRNLIEFIESNPYQVQIFGHSCGLSDRTLLNTIFEHENCISIKPFYYENEGSNDYEQKSYSIARHFKSKSELRVKVVNKEYCEAMIQPEKSNSHVITANPR